jgi:hypothetical protein
VKIAGGPDGLALPIWRAAWGQFFNGKPAGKEQPLTIKVGEGGRTVIVHRLIATGVDADGKREILGFDVTSAGDGAGRLAPTAR